jgi:hypothetical protein
LPKTGAPPPGELGAWERSMTGSIPVYPAP